MARKQKQEGRKHARAIGDAVEIDCVNEHEQQGFLAFRVPNPRKKFGAKFQQKGAYATWDVLVVLKAIPIQCKRRKKYMSKEDIIIHRKSCKLFPKTELTPMLCWRDLGLKYEDLS